MVLVAFSYKSLVLAIGFNALETPEKSFNGINCFESAVADYPVRFLLKGRIIPFLCLWRRLDKSVWPLWTAEYPAGSFLF